MGKLLAKLYLEHQVMIEGACVSPIHVIDKHWAGGVRAMIYAKWEGWGAEYINAAYHYLIQQFKAKEVQKLYTLQAREAFME